jgi:hypothetical protein
MQRHHFWVLLAVSFGGARAQAPSDTATIPDPVAKIYGKACAENWVVFGGGYHQTYLYIPRTIRTTEKGTKTVWGVNVQSMTGADSAADLQTSRAAITEVRGNSHLGEATLQKYGRYLQTKVQWEVDCVHQRVRILQCIDYDEDGNVLLSFEVPGTLEDPVPETNGEGLLRAFCNPAHRNYFRDLFNGAPPKR